MEEIEKNKADDLILLQRAMNNDHQARQKLYQQIEPILFYQSQRLCKRFCKDNRFHYSCSLPFKPYPGKKDRLLCEWGNGSYGWMLGELTSEKRLSAFRHENNASFYHYCYQVANSISFYERWKNWRFSRRVYVPEYIRDIDENAQAVFFALQKAEPMALIAQQLQLSEQQLASISRKIVIELTKRKKLYLLDTPSMISISSSSEEGDELDIAVNDESMELQEQKLLLAKAWQQLTALEQFVVQHLMLEKQDASELLDVITAQAGEFPEHELEKIHDRQSLYYFRRKTVEKLSRLVKR